MFQGRIFIKYMLRTDESQCRKTKCQKDVSENVKDTPGNVIFTKMCNRNLHACLGLAVHLHTGYEELTENQ